MVVQKWGMAGMGDALGEASHLFNEDPSARLFATKSGSSRTSALIHTLPCKGSKEIEQQNPTKLCGGYYTHIAGWSLPLSGLLSTQQKMLATCNPMRMGWECARCPQWDFAGLEQISWLQPAGGLELETEYDLVTYNAINMTICHAHLQLKEGHAVGPSAAVCWSSLQRLPPGTPWKPALPCGCCYFFCQCWWLPSSWAVTMFQTLFGMGLVQNCQLVSPKMVQVQYDIFSEKLVRISSRVPPTISKCVFPDGFSCYSH